jgi:hypothetical protein
MLLSKCNLLVNWIEVKRQLLSSGHLDLHEWMPSTYLEGLLILKQIDEQIRMSGANIIDLLKYQFCHVAFLADFPPKPMNSPFSVQLAATPSSLV